MSRAVAGLVAENRLFWLLLAGFGLFPFFTQIVDQPFWDDVAIRIMVLATAALGLNLILGFGGMVSFGHAAWLGVGAYSVVIAQSSGVDNGWLHLMIALAVTGVLGMVIGLLSLRTTGLYFIMITLAFAQMMFFFFVGLETFGGDDGVVIDRAEFPPFDIYDGATLYYLTWGVMLLASVLLMLLTRSRFGTVLQAIKDNPARVEAMGLPLLRFRALAFVISAMIGAMAGVMFANWQEFVSPDVMHWSRSGELLIIIVLGGMARLPGPLVGAVVFLLLEEILPEIMHAVAPAYADNWMIVFGPLLIMVVLFAPGGVLGMAVKFRRLLGKAGGTP
ncbi:MAG: branched-chain amino acid ABC transporter permease [Candidatus Puniceispirillales bacterium]